jgi:flavorubredoxin
MSEICEVGPDIFRISTYNPDFNLQFNQFLVRDEEPLLFHTGMKGMFPIVRDAVATLMDPAALRWIGFSHFEADECGSLNEWLQVAPKAQAVCILVGASVSVNDFAIREARPMMHDEVMSTGKRRFRFQQTPQVPHCWDAGLLFEETTGTLFASDLLGQNGNVEAKTTTDVLDRAREMIAGREQGPLAGYTPYTPQTDGILQGLAALEPKMLATMHGSSYEGDGGRAIRDLAVMMKEYFVKE